MLKLASTFLSAGLDINRFIKKSLAALLIITFVFPYPALYAKQIDPAKEYNLQFEKQYNDFIKKFKGLNLENPGPVHRFIIDLSEYIKEQVDSKAYKNVFETSNEQRWINLGVLQMDMLRYWDTAKDIAEYSAPTKQLRVDELKDFKFYLQTAHRTVDELNQKYPGIDQYVTNKGIVEEATVRINNNGSYTEIHIDKLGLTFTGVNANKDVLVVRDGVLIPTGAGFNEDFIASRLGKWDNITEIMRDYKEYSDRYGLSFPITLQDEFRNFIKDEHLGDMQKYREIIFQGLSWYYKNTAGEHGRVRIQNVMVLQQLYEELYFKALENTARIYMGNMFIYMNSEYNKISENTFVTFFCPLMDERNSQATKYKTAKYAQYKCRKKMKEVVKDQMGIISEHTDIFKTSTMTEMTDRINESVIPGIIQARKELAEELGTEPGKVVQRVVKNGEVDKALGNYYAKLNSISNQYKESRFLFADETLRNRFFGQPFVAGLHKSTTVVGDEYATFTVNPEPYKSNESVWDEKKSQYVHVSSVKVDDLSKAFALSQQTLKEYIYKLNSTYQNIMDDHLNQRFAQRSIDQKGQDFLMSEKVWSPSDFEELGTLTELTKEENYVLDSIVDVSIEAPSTREIYREKPEYRQMLGTIDSYVKSKEEARLRDQSVRNTLAVIGAVVGTVLLFTGIGSYAGAALLGITSATLAAFELAAGIVFTFTMVAETSYSIQEHSQAKGDIKKLLTAKSGANDIDLSYLNELDEKESKALKSAILSGFFSVLGVVGGGAGLKGLLGFSRAEELGKWAANFSEQLESDKDFADAMRTLQTNLSVGNDASKFELFIKYAQKAGISTDDMKTLAYKITPADGDLPFLNKPFSKAGTQGFKKWYTGNGNSGLLAYGNITPELYADKSLTFIQDALNSPEKLTAIDNFLCQAVSHGIVPGTAEYDELLRSLENVHTSEGDITVMGTPKNNAYLEAKDKYIKMLAEKNSPDISNPSVTARNEIRPLVEKNVLGVRIQIEYGYLRQYDISVLQKELERLKTYKEELKEALFNRGSRSGSQEDVQDALSDVQSSHPYGEDYSPQRIAYDYDHYTGSGPDGELSEYWLGSLDDSYGQYDIVNQRIAEIEDELNLRRTAAMVQHPDNIVGGVSKPFGASSVTDAPLYGDVPKPTTSNYVSKLPGETEKYYYAEQAIMDKLDLVAAEGKAQIVSEEKYLIETEPVSNDQLYVRKLLTGRENNIGEIANGLSKQAKEGLIGINTVQPGATTSPLTTLLESNNIPAENIARISARINRLSDVVEPLPVKKIPDDYLYVLDNSKLPELEKTKAWDAAPTKPKTMSKAEFKEYVKIKEAEYLLNQELTQPQKDIILKKLRGQFISDNDYAQANFTKDQLDLLANNGFIPYGYIEPQLLETISDDIVGVGGRLTNEQKNILKMAVNNKSISKTRLKNAGFTPEQEYKLVEKYNILGDEPGKQYLASSSITKNRVTLNGSGLSQQGKDYLSSKFISTTQSDFNAKLASLVKNENEIKNILQGRWMTREVRNQVFNILYDTNLKGLDRYVKLSELNLGDVRLIKLLLLGENNDLLGFEINFNAEFNKVADILHTRVTYYFGLPADIKRPYPLSIRDKKAIIEYSLTKQPSILEQVFDGGQMQKLSDAGYLDGASRYTTRLPIDLSTINDKIYNLNVSVSGQRAEEFINKAIKKGNLTENEGDKLQQIIDDVESGMQYSNHSVPMDLETKYGKDFIEIHPNIPDIYVLKIPGPNAGEIKYRLYYAFIRKEAKGIQHYFVKYLGQDVQGGPTISLETNQKLFDSRKAFIKEVFSTTP